MEGGAVEGGAGGGEAVAGVCMDRVGACLRLAEEGAQGIEVPLRVVGASGAEVPLMVAEVLLQAAAAAGVQGHLQAVAGEAVGVGVPLQVGAGAAVRGGVPFLVVVAAGVADEEGAAGGAARGR